MAFRHDEIRDYKDNIRIDYGYAMTIASAQGLTVDRTFLLVDDRPARETIYPAATRHREGIDIYVNRSPLAFDIADRRPEDQAEMPVTDSDVRAYLAERWSRSQPKEAALDYVSEGAWRDPREEPPHHGRKAGETRKETAEASAAANDNALVRIAQEMRHAVNGWRHGATVDAFAAERSEVLAAWDELRARTRDEGESVALSPAFRETLDRHGALMKQAASFRSRPRTYQRLLADRAGIGERDLEELREVHARAGRYRRSAAGRAAQDRQGERVAERSQEHEPAREKGIDAAEAASVRPPAGEPARGRTQAPELSQAAYRRLRREWQEHLRQAERQGVHPFDLDGAAGLVERIGAFAGREGLPAEPRRRLEETVLQYGAHAGARDRLRDHMRDVERHWRRYESIVRRARALDRRPEDSPSWRSWLERNERLLRAGRAILDDPGTYGPHLDRADDGGEGLRSALSRMERFSSAQRTQSRSRDRGPTRSL